VGAGVSVTDLYLTATPLDVCWLSPSIGIKANDKMLPKKLDIQNAKEWT
jgi:hypothetical protein